MKTLLTIATIILGILTFSCYSLPLTLLFLGAFCVSMWRLSVIGGDAE